MRIPVLTTIDLHWHQQTIVELHVFSLTRLLKRPIEISHKVLRRLYSTHQTLLIILNISQRLIRVLISARTRYTACETLHRYREDQKEPVEGIPYPFPQQRYMPDCAWGQAMVCVPALDLQCLW